MICSPSSSSGTNSWPHVPSPPPPAIASFWQNECLQSQLRSLHDMIDSIKSVQKELEAVVLAKASVRTLEESGIASDAPLRDNSPAAASCSIILSNASQSALNDFSDFKTFLDMIKMRRLDLSVHESLAVEAANSLIATLKIQVAPFTVITGGTNSWEEKSAAVKLASKMLKSKRNKRWRKKKRTFIAELLRKQKIMLEQAERNADEWRAREIARDMAKRKMEKMKEIAQIKAKQERKRLQSELELVLVVEKLQELRSVRIKKLKKQGCFLPDEDNTFLEKVRAAVEEEERLAAATATTDAAKDAIATAEECRMVVEISGIEQKDGGGQGHLPKAEDGGNISAAAHREATRMILEGYGYGRGYESVSSLPREFYHYYHGSNADMGTLIEVRRQWDSFIRCGGSRIPGHWVLPPPPADEIWASCLVLPRIG